MKKRILKIVIIVLLSISLILPCFSQMSGKLNVFTDLADAEIYVDGRLAGKEAVVGYVLPVGSHYVKVIYKGKTAFAKTVDIEEGRTNTITSEHFVDIRTSTPSRGAVEVEAERLRAYRGNGAFGFHGISPNTGLSVKHWFSRDYGIQAIGFANSDSTYMDDSLGFRFLVGFPKKIFSEEVLDAYMALGYARAWHHDKIDSANDFRSESSSIAFGVEAKIGELANALFMTQSYVAEDMEDITVLFIELISLGLLNICYTSLEIGMEQQTLYNGNSYDVLSNMKINFGLHYYF